MPQRRADYINPGQRKFNSDGTLNPHYRRRSGSSGSTNRKNEHPMWTAPIVAWDGEGVTIDGKHTYVALCNSEGGQLVNPAGLTTDQCLRFMLSESIRLPHRLHVGFVFSYDANMILGDLEQDDVSCIWTAQGSAPYTAVTVNHQSFEVFYRPRKCFGVRKGGWKSGQTWKYDATLHGHVLVWDVFGFFQTSFVKTLEKWMPKDPYLSYIRTMKAQRHDFNADQLPEIVHYCEQECIALAELMMVFRASMSETELRPRRWDGAGALAASLMESRAVKRHIQPIPPDVERASQFAYFGGRMELVQYGNHEAPIYHYDINSAYPAAMLQLPNLAGTWKLEANGSRQPFSVSFVYWDDRRRIPIHPLPFREQFGNVYFPRNAAHKSGLDRNTWACGWYWEPEVRMCEELARKHKGFHFAVQKTWNFYPATDERPYDFLPDLFEQRRQWKNAGNPAEKPLKLAINSLYGKHAQQLGWNPKTGKRPPFHCLAYAGFVTSWTRAQLYRAAMQKPKAVVMLATDGIWTTELLDLPCGDGLGEWESGIADGLTIVQSGVYWVNEDGQWRLMCRGYDKDETVLNRDAILRAWAERRKSIDIPATRFIGMGSALAGGEQWGQWRQWKTIQRNLDLTVMGTKRENCECTGNPSTQLISTRASRLISRDYQSRPYPLVWQGEERDNELVDGIDASEVLREIDDGENE